MYCKHKNTILRPPVIDVPPHLSSVSSVGVLSSDFLIYY
jgi:hypothetical protein